MTLRLLDESKKVPRLRLLEMEKESRRIHWSEIPELRLPEKKEPFSELAFREFQKQTQALKPYKPYFNFILTPWRVVSNVAQELQEKGPQGNILGTISRSLPGAYAIRLIGKPNKDRADIAKTILGTLLGEPEKEMDPYKIVNNVGESLESVGVLPKGSTHKGVKFGRYMLGMEENIGSRATASLLGLGLVFGSTAGISRGMERLVGLRNRLLVETKAQEAIRVESAAPRIRALYRAGRVEEARELAKQFARKATTSAEAGLYAGLPVPKNIIQQFKLTPTQVSNLQKGITQGIAPAVLSAIEKAGYVIPIEKPPKIRPAILPKAKVKPLIREVTGQVKIGELIREDIALKEVLRKETKIGKEAFREGRKKGLEIAQEDIQKLEAEIAKGDFRSADEKLAYEIYYEGKIAKARRLSAEKLQEIKDIASRKRMRDRVRIETNNLLKKVRRIDVSEMSPQHAIPIRDIQTQLDFAKPSTKTLASLNNTRTYLENNPDAELPDYVFEDLTRLEKLNRDDMTLDQLRSLEKSIAHHIHLERTKRKIKVGREQKRAKKVLEDSIAEMKPPPEVKMKIIKSQKTDTGRTKKVGRLLKDTFGIRHDHYDLIVESLAGPNSTMDKVLYQEVKEGIINQLRYRQKVYKTFQNDVNMQDFMKKHKIKNTTTWLNEKVTIGRWELTRGERMALYRHSLNENNLRHILEGGVGFKHSDTPFLPQTITGEEVNNIVNSLTEAEREWSGKPVNNLFDNQHVALNKTFYEKNGYELPKETNYYPIEVMKTALPKDLEAESILEELKHKWVRVGIKKGMLEHRVKSTLPIYLNNIAYDINKSVMNAAAYVGLEMPLSNASKLLYNRGFRAQIYNRYSPQTWIEVEKGLRDIAGDWQSYTTTEELLMMLKNRLSTAILSISFAIPKQLLSFSLYNVYCKAEYLTQGFVDYAQHPLELIERHKSYSPEFAERIEGGYSRDVADVFKTGAEKKLTKGKRSVPEKLMGGIKLFDINAVTPGMQGCVLQVLDEFEKGKFSPEVKTALNISEGDIPRLSSEERIKLAYKFADWVTERTQPMFSPEHRSSLSRGSAVEKLATQFTSFTNQALNLIRRTWRRAQDTNDPQMHTKLAKVLFYLFVVNTGGVMVIDTVRDRMYRREQKKRRGIGERYGEAVLDSVFSYFYFLRDLEKSVVSKVKRGTFTGYDISLPVLGFADKTGDMISNGIRMFAERKPAKREKIAKQFIDDIISIITMSQGIPYQTPKKLITRGGKKKKSTKGLRLLR